MPQEFAVEERLAALEAEVAELKRRLEFVPCSSSWLEQVVGSMEGQPAFEEAMRLARDWKNADRPARDN